VGTSAPAGSSTAPVASDVLSAVLERLEQVRTSGAGYAASCPAHDDHHPSLSITEGRDGRVLLKCHAAKGCDVDSIVKALGMTTADLFPKNGMHRPRAHESLGAVAATYDYIDEGGVVLYQVLRYVPKTFRPRRKVNGEWAYGLKGVRRILYRLPELLAAVAAGEPVYVAEGEKDVESLRATGVVATCNQGGAKSWREEYAEHFRGASVIVVVDKDEDGRRWAADVAASLDEVATSVTFVEAAEGKDATDHLDSCYGLDDFLPVDLSDTTPPVAPPVRPFTSSDAAELNESTNGHRFAVMHADVARFVPGMDWLVYEPLTGAWRMDPRAANRLAEATGKDWYRVARDECVDQSVRDKVTRQAKASLSARGIASTLELAANVKALERAADELDPDPMLFNCVNGVIDLRSGELLKHDPKYMMTRASPVHYDPDASHPVLRAYLADVTEGKGDFGPYLRRCLGYTLTGMMHERVFFLVLGPTTTGKSTFEEAVVAMLGSYAVVTNMDAFLRRSTVGAVRNDLADLPGARLVTGVEVDRTRRLDETLVKQIVDGDAISTRRLFKEYFSFHPQCKLWFAANAAPRMNDEDDALWIRAHDLPFDNPIPEEKRDPRVKEVLRDPAGGGPALLAEAVRGCLEWQREGLGSCAAVTEAGRALRSEMDPYFGFFDDRIIEEAGVRTRHTAVVEAVRAWQIGNGSRPDGPVNARSLSVRMEKRGFVGGKDKHGRYWEGIRLLGAGCLEQTLPDAASS
jgi:putative DNA primase/helicase